VKSLHSGVQDRPHAIQMPSDDPPGGHDISFDHVTFSYRPDQPILQVCSATCFLLFLSCPFCCVHAVPSHTDLVVGKLLRSRSWSAAQWFDSPVCCWPSCCTLVASCVLLLLLWPLAKGPLAISRAVEPFHKVVADHSLLTAGTDHHSICTKISTSLESVLESQAQ